MAWAPGKEKPGGGFCKVWRQEQQALAPPLPVLLYLPGADGRATLALPKEQKKYGADVSFYDNFIVVSPEVNTHWRSEPYLW